MSISGGDQDLVPSAPSNLSVTPVYQGMVKISWQDNSDNEEYFQIERKVEGGEYEDIAHTQANENVCVDRNLNPNATYWYRVCAVNQHGKSEYIEEHINLSVLKPIPAKNLEAEVTPKGCVHLRWNESLDALQYVIARRVEGQPFVRIATLDAPTTEYTDRSTFLNTTYVYKIIAKNGFGETDSEEDSVTTPSIPSDLESHLISYEYPIGKNNQGTFICKAFTIGNRKLLIGTTYLTADSDTRMGIMMKVAPNGLVEFAKAYAYEGNDGDARDKLVFCDALKMGDNIYICGTYAGKPAIFKMDTEGNLIYVKTVDINIIGIKGFNSITTDGNYIYTAVGPSSGISVVAKFNQDGDLETALEIRPSYKLDTLIINKMVYNNSSLYILGKSSVQSWNANNGDLEWDMVLLKLDPSLALQQACSYFNKIDPNRSIWGWHERGVDNLKPWAEDGKLIFSVLNIGSSNDSCNGVTVGIIDGDSLNILKALSASFGNASFSGAYGHTLGRKGDNIYCAVGGPNCRNYLFKYEYKNGNLSFTTATSIWLDKYDFRPFYIGLDYDNRIFLVGSHQSPKDLMGGHSGMDILEYSQNDDLYIDSYTPRYGEVSQKVQLSPNSVKEYSDLAGQAAIRLTTTTSTPNVTERHECRVFNIENISPHFVCP